MCRVLHFWERQSPFFHYISRSWHSGWIPLSGTNRPQNATSLHFNNNATHLDHERAESCNKTKKKKEIKMLVNSDHTCGSLDSCFG